MTLLKESCFVHGVGANGLGKFGRDGMKVVEIDRGVALEFTTDAGVIQPLDLDKVGNLLSAIFLGDL